MEEHIVKILSTRNEISGNTLIFANKTKADIILEAELSNMPGSAFISILSDEKNDEYFHGKISEDFLKIHLGDLNKKFYVCGPPPMTDAVLKQLANLGVGENSITLEL